MIAIRELQHYLYCPHRWGLLYCDDMWQENAFTVRAEILHENVHSGRKLVSTKTKTDLSNVTVFSNEYGIYGKTDRLELRLDKNGISVLGYDGKYKPTVIECKPTQPDGEPCFADEIQLLAQKVCLDEMFGCDVDAYFYYFDTRRRVKIDFKDEKILLKNLVAEIEEYKSRSDVPAATYGKKCAGCSMKDVCMPKCDFSNVKGAILKTLGEL